MPGVRALSPPLPQTSTTPLTQRGAGTCTPASGTAAGRWPYRPGSSAVSRTAESWPSLCLNLCRLTLPPKCKGRWSRAPAGRSVFCSASSSKTVPRGIGIAPVTRWLWPQGDSPSSLALRLPTCTVGALAHLPRRVFGKCWGPGVAKVQRETGKESGSSTKHQVEGEVTGDRTRKRTGRF